MKNGSDFGLYSIYSHTPKRVDATLGGMAQVGGCGKVKTKRRESSAGSAALERVKKPTHKTLSSPLKKMIDADLKKLFECKTKAYILRTIILNEKQFPSVNYSRGQRSFWYSSVKPILSRSGMLKKEDETEEGISKWDSLLSDTLADLVRKGALSYYDLNIEDNSRQREIPCDTYLSVDNSVYGYKSGDGRHKNIVLCSEKDTAYSIIRDVAAIFGCSCLSGKGQNSLAAMESLMRRIDPTQDILILTFTDYDPAGFLISETFKKQMLVFRDVLGIKGDISSERLGINKEHLTVVEKEENKYIPKRAGLSKWVEAGHGIRDNDGNVYGLELDALPPNRLRKIFIESLQKYIPANAFDDLADSFIRMKALETMKPLMKKVLSRISFEFSRQVVKTDSDIFDFDRQEYDSLPVEKMFELENEEDFEERVLAVLKDRLQDKNLTGE